MSSVVGHPLTLSVVVLLFFSTPGLAQVCNVPTGSHPTVQAAVDDLSCTEVVVSAGTFAEEIEVARSLSISGASNTTTIIEGRLIATGASTAITLNTLKIDGGAVGCLPAALDVSDGATVTGTDFVAVNSADGPCPVFGDGFESGDTTAWSDAVP